MYSTAAVAHSVPFAVSVARYDMREGGAQQDLVTEPFSLWLSLFALRNFSNLRRCDSEAAALSVGSNAALTPFPDSDDEPLGDGGIWFRFRFQVGLDANQHQATTAALKELVDLRNELVHHFLQRFNIWEPQGCMAADAYLDAIYETIDGHYLTLRGWAQGMDEARAAMASFMSTAAFEDLLVNGIAPDGTVDWPASGAVRCLREAETKLGTEGWTLLNTATAWIRAQHPDQHPQRYCCGSWRHVIHESRQFEIRRTVNTEQGCGEVWYRSRQEGASMHGKKSS